MSQVILKRIDLTEKKHANEKCHCPYCTFCGKVRGAIRRGDKKEMRAMLRELMVRYVDIGQEMMVLKSFVATVMSQEQGEATEEKADTIQ